MPVWHEATREPWENGAINVVGIVQEQHPERSRLFMQWKKMDWPVMVDALNLLGVSAVPITLFLDEQGIICRIRPKLDELSTFLKESPSSGENLLPFQATAPNLPNLRERADRDGSEHLRDYADALFLWGGPSNSDAAVRAFEKLVRLYPDNGAIRFGLGVVLRNRYDSVSKEPADFHRAIEAWSDAQPKVQVLKVHYANVIEKPMEEAERIAAFLEIPLDTKKMAAVVDSDLYRNKV